MESNIKEQFLENKKSITKATDEVRAIAEEFKKKNQQKQVDDEKKNTELKNWVEQTIAKNSKNGEEDVKTISKKIDTLKVEL
jgi:predicted phage gp36 major capsid-like protein